MSYTTNKKAPPTLARIAALLGTDNRTVVASPDPNTAGNVVVASSLVGKNANTFGVGATAGTVANAANAYAVGPPATAAYGSVTAANARVAKIAVETPLNRANLRTGYFLVNPGQKGGGLGGMNPIDYTARKQCYVNLLGQPLDANGVPTTPALAVNAATTPLTALGQAVGNYAVTNKTSVGRSALPGVYGLDTRQTSTYAPYVGWTAQNTPRADAT